jgi:hypothetical protein
MNECLSWGLIYRKGYSNQSLILPAEWQTKAAAGLFADIIPALEHGNTPMHRKSIL